MAKKKYIVNIIPVQQENHSWEWEVSRTYMVEKAGPVNEHECTESKSGYADTYEEVCDGIYKALIEENK